MLLQTAPYKMLLQSGRVAVCTEIKKTCPINLGQPKQSLWGLLKTQLKNLI